MMKVKERKIEHSFKRVWTIDGNIFLEQNNLTNR